LYVLFWLVFSYLPKSIISLPEIAFQGNWYTANSSILFSLCAGLFLAIQIKLVFSTGTFFKGQPYLFSEEQTESTGQEQPSRNPGFKLSRSRELFWTALPIVMTILVLIASYPLM